MKRDYVIYKGKRYNSGDTIDILWYKCGYSNKCNHIGTFVDCDEEEDEYRFIVDGITYCFNKACFYRTMKDEPLPNETKNKNSHKATFIEELCIDGLLIAWTWYVFIMLVAIIFYDRVVIWVVSSIIFFSYRSRKLKEAGYK